MAWHGTRVVEYRLDCDLCGFPYDRVSTSLKTLERDARLDGWRIGGGRYACPDCAGKEHPWH